MLHMLCKNATSSNLYTLLPWALAGEKHRHSMGKLLMGILGWGHSCPALNKSRRAYSWELAPPRLAPKSHQHVQHWQPVTTCVQLHSVNNTLTNREPTWMQKPAAAQHIQLHKQKLQAASLF